jgi:hypothetical protein
LPIVNARRTSTFQIVFGSALIVRAVDAVQQSVSDHRDPYRIGVHVVAGLLAIAVVFVGIRARRRAKLVTTPT